MNNHSSRVHPVFIPACYTAAMMACPLVLRWVAAFAVLAAPLTAAPRKLRVDREASKVQFVAKATMHSVEGWIEDWDLEVTVPEGSALPDVAVFKGNGMSMTTDHKKRDTEMHQWMEHVTLPAVEFRLKQFTGTASGRVAEGDLTLHGVTMPVSVPVTMECDRHALTVAGEVVIDTSKFGLPHFRKFGMLTVDTRVTVRFSVRGTFE